MTNTLHRPDHELKAAIVEELRWIPNVNSDRIGVSVNHGAVTLSGEVESYPEKHLAAKTALHVRGVTAIAEELTVRTNWGTANDSDIARDAAQALERAIDVPDDAVKATVHDHVITLSGQVPWHYQRESARRAVKYIKGVKDVANAVVIKPTVSASGTKDAIRAAFERSAQFESSHTTVTASADGTVTLEGTVHSFADRHIAETAAWQAPGVTGVVNNLRIKS
jgi:osmotically-inducible protein OsmY